MPRQKTVRTTALGNNLPPFLTSTPAARLAVLTEMADLWLLCIPSPRGVSELTSEMHGNIEEKCIFKPTIFDMCQKIKHLLTVFGFTQTKSSSSHRNAHPVPTQYPEG